MLREAGTESIAAQGSRFRADDTAVRRSGPVRRNGRDGKMTSDAYCGNAGFCFILHNGFPYEPQDAAPHGKRNTLYDMRKTLTALLCFILSAAATAEEPRTLRIEPLHNEKWWGLFTGGGPNQPFAAPFDTAGYDTCGVFVTPFMLSGNGRFIRSDTPFAVHYDGTAFTVTAAEGRPETGKGGRTLREAYLYCVHKYVWAQDPPADNRLFPQPVYDTGLSARLTAASGAALLAAADSVAAKGYPAGTLLISDGWQDHAAEGCFDRNLYDSFPALAAELARRGFSVMLTVTPYIPAAGPDYVASRREGLLLAGPDGRPAIVRTPSGYYACLDMTQPEAVARLDAKLTRAREAGVAGFYFDCHRVRDAVACDETFKTYMEHWTAHGQRHGAAMYPLAQEAPAQWLPYSLSPEGGISWESLRRTLETALDAGLTGHTYPYLSLTSSAGHCADERLLLRAVQLALFMPLAAVPADGSLFTDEACRRALRQSVALRMEMNEYMTELLHEAAATGEPLMRHMEYQFPGQGFWNCTDQYMLGARYLVAPVLDDRDKRTVRLPRGTWIAADGTKYRGPRVLNVDVSDGSIPVFRLR